jgi:uncharacterized membrane protein YqjE
VIVTVAEEHPSQSDHSGGHEGHGETMSSLTRLLTASQGGISKRIDLAVLETHESLSRTLRRATLVALGLVLAAAAWFALAASLVLVINANATPALRLATFGLLNAGAAFGVVAIAMRNRSRAAAWARAHETSTDGEQ